MYRVCFFIKEQKQHMKNIYFKMTITVRNMNVLVSYSSMKMEAKRKSYRFEVSWQQQITTVLYHNVTKLTPELCKPQNNHNWTKTWNHVMILQTCFTWLFDITSRIRYTLRCKHSFLKIAGKISQVLFD